jgi:hypothetical protein
VFVLFMLAAAHLFMVAINAAEADDTSTPSPAAGVTPARIFSATVRWSEELEAALWLAPTAVADAGGARGGARASPEAGEAIALRTLPVTPFLVAGPRWA